jgi:hypothetical protein
VPKIETSRAWYAYAPGWCGNRSQPDAFTVEIARRTIADVEAFQTAALETRMRWLGGGDEAPTADALFALFDGFVRGPFGGALEIDGTKIERGDLRGLCEAMLAEAPIDASLFGDLCRAAIEINTLSEDARKNSERRRGGAGGTPATTAASPLP